MESALIESLALWGCDIEGAMKRFLDDEDFYIDCIRVAAAELGDLSSLEKAISCSDSNSAFEIMHYFKGAFANLGLTPVLKTIDQATELFRSGTVEGAEALTEALRAQCSRLNEILST